MKSEDLILSERCLFWDWKTKICARSNRWLKISQTDPFGLTWRARTRTLLGCRKMLATMTVISGDAVVAMEWLDIMYIIYIHMFWMGFLMRERKCTCWNQFRLYFPGGFSYSGSVSPSTQRETGRTQCLRQYITLLFTLIRAANGGPPSRRFWHLWVEIVLTVCQESGDRRKARDIPSWTDSCRSQVPRSPVVWCRDCCACKGTKGAGKLDISGRYTACTVPPQTRPLGAAWVGCCPYKAIDV